MLGFRQRHCVAREAGGVILGRYVRDCDDVVVDEVTVPTRRDRRTRTRYHRDARDHQRVIDARWEGSAGTCLYLGEWHTHPEPIPSPSSVDLAEWKRRLQNDQFDGDALLFLIVGTKTVGAWEGLRSTLEIRMLELVTETKLS
jgi:integrative and conjugative element protein (TIGR02256 family)